MLGEYIAEPYVSGFMVKERFFWATIEAMDYEDTVEIRIVI
jgi:hypothetical protein